MGSRIDAEDKARGRSRYTADVRVPGQLYVAKVRSTERHARIVRIDADTARSMPGIVGVFTAADITGRTFGRRVRDVPVLARDKVRFLGERVAAVVGETPEQAEEAALFVEIEYDPLPPVTDPEGALAPEAACVHDAPWTYENARVTEDDPHNLQSRVVHGDAPTVDEALSSAEHVVELTYSSPAGHHGYIEPQACVVAPQDDGTFRVWVTDKTPYRIRNELSQVTGIDTERIRIEPVVIGGDFGGKGSFGEAPLCLELARLTGRPIRSVLTYGEDLVATAPRHAVDLRVKMGCDADGRLTAVRVDALVDGGAYAGMKPRPPVALRGIEEAGSCYRFEHLYIDQQVVYTNSVPRGHYRTPGAPEMAFAFESSLDELGHSVGLTPEEIRRRNVVSTGAENSHGQVWAEARGHDVLDAVLEAARARPPAPEGWLEGTGLAIAEHATPVAAKLSMRLTLEDDGTLRADVGVAETGTGSHTVVREGLARALGLDPERLKVVHVPTSELAFDHGVGGSRVTAGLSQAVGQAAEAWRDRGDRRTVTVDVDATWAQPVTSFCAQIAQTAVHPSTGEYRVLRLVQALDVAEVINQAAHRMQLEGGAIMGFGMACLEDLQIEDGQVWAANLGEFKLPTTQDIPRMETLLVGGAKGVGALNTKAAGEITNVPTAAAIANSIRDACGARMHRLPLRAEDIWRELRQRLDATSTA